MDNTCHAVEDAVLHYAAQHALFAENAVVYAAVSGGADSMALLRVLLAIAPKYQLRVRACHVNHCLRAAAADQDEAFVRAQCAALGVPLVVFHAAQDGHAPPPNAGEAWARTLRYGYFETLLAQGGTFVATAHTLNDQAETLLFRLARGTGVHGAGGIRPRRARYLRPFLCLTRAEVEAYCAAAMQAYVQDETNASPQYARNRLRAQAVPALCNANEAAVQHLGQFCEKMADVDAYFAHLAAALLAQAAQHAQQMALDCAEGNGLLPEPCSGRYALCALQAADPLVLEAAMYQLVCPLRDPEQKYTKALCAVVAAQTGAVQVTDAFRFVVKNGFLSLENIQSVPVKTQTNVQYYPVGVGEYRFPAGYGVKIEQFTPEIMEKIHLVHKKDLKNYADYDKIVSSLTLRCRRQGDVFSPCGRGVSKTVKKLHNELGVPEQTRGLLPLLADGHTVVWLWGQGFAEGYAPSSDTKRILKITEEKNAEEPQYEHKHG